MAELWDVYDENGNKTGQLHERGIPLPKGAYHLVVHIWIVNAKGEYLITKRSPGISWAGFWQATGGSATTGDDSLSAALRETKEEIGIDLDPANGFLFEHRREEYAHTQGGGFIDAWLFRQEIALDDIALQPEETCDAMWATPETILQMRAEGTFLPPRMNPYLEDLFALCTHLPGNIYFLAGTSCGGKTTAANSLCEKYNAYIYSSDDMRNQHFLNAQKSRQPAMATPVSDSTALPPAEAAQWERDILREMTFMMLADLRTLAAVHPLVICEGVIDLDRLMPLVDPQQVVYLTVDHNLAKQTFFDRPSHIHLLDDIKNRTDLTDDEKQRRIQNMHALIALMADAPPPVALAKYGVHQHNRTAQSTVESMLACIEAHFGLATQTYTN